MYVELPGEDKEYKLLAFVKELKRYQDVKFIGTSNDNPMLNTAVYSVETPNGYIAEYKANVISEYLYIQVGGDRYKYSMLYESFGQKKTDDVISM